MASVVTDPATARLDIVVRNLTEAPLLINGMELGQASLSLDIQHASGKPVAHLPPPVPDFAAVADQMRSLAPGEQLAATMQGMDVDPAEMPPGKYHARIAIRTEDAQGLLLQSEWVRFELR